jgi:hypothetical protein
MTGIDIEGGKHRMNSVLLNCFSKSVAIAIISLAVGRCSASVQPVEKVYTADGIHRWTFFNGPEFPGATGYLSASGHGSGAALNFRFTCGVASACKQYVEAIGRLDTAAVVTSRTVLKLLVKMPSELTLGVRVKDETGQTLQYSVDVATLEEPDPMSGREIVIPLWSRTPVHWGGSNRGIIDGKIVEVGILVKARLNKPSQGALIFYNVCIASVDSTEVSINRSLKNLYPPAAAGPLASLLGINIHSALDDASLQLAKEMGFSFARTDLLWKSIEQSNHFSFSEADHYLAQLRQKGLGVMWLLGYGHPDHGGKVPKTPEDVAAFGRYAAAVSKHFIASDVRFEVWNEPDGTIGDPATFSPILSTAVAAIHRQNPSAEISSGGLAGFNIAFLQALLSSGALAGVNAVGIHPYRRKPETVRFDLIDAESLIATNAGHRVPVWDTEWGYSTYSDETKEAHGNGHSPEAEQRQAVLAVREILSAWVSGFPMIVWYDLCDDNRNPLDLEGNFGLLRSDHTPKPALSSIETLSRAAIGRDYKGLVQGLPKSCHAIRLESPEEIMFILWSDDENFPVTASVSSENGISITDMMGRERRLGGTESSSTLVYLTERQGPLYIRYRK